MKWTNYVSALLLVACAGASATWAQAPGVVQRRMVLEALDLDRDGEISATEIEQASLSLRQLDRDQDGRILLAELMAPRADSSPAENELAHQVMSFDKQGKGYVVAEDLPARMRGIFERADRNHDGKLTLQELQAAGSHQNAPAGGGNARQSAVEFFRRDPLLMAIDLNHDGELSQEEIAHAAESLLTLDKNHDGKLTADEIRQHQMTPEERAHHVMGEFDGDGDGKISRAESPARMLNDFAQIDTNGDGYLDLQEMIAFFAHANANAKNGEGNTASRPVGKE